MPQRGTEDALYILIEKVRARLREKKLVVLVSLDIEGAFNNAWWPVIKLRLLEEQCSRPLINILHHYPSDRSIKLRYAGKEITKNTNKGCVQGSIGGPILWNLLLDPLLRSLMEQGTMCKHLRMT